MHENTEFTLSRDCEAIQIPSGQKVTIPSGTPGVITQALGGSYTVATYQGLARIAEKISMRSVWRNPTPAPEKSERRGNGEVSRKQLEPAEAMLRPGNSGKHCRSWSGLRLPVNEEGRRRHEGGREDDADRARLRNGPGDRARRAKQNPHDRRHRRSGCPARLGSALESKHDQRSRADEARDGLAFFFFHRLSFYRPAKFRLVRLLVSGRPTVISRWIE